MFLADLHTHSLCSPDGFVPMGEMARAAGAAGLNVLCVTDHCDLLDLHGAFTPHYDWDAVRRAYAEALEQRPDGLELRLGVELGEAYESPETARDILAQAPALDFVIGSVHNFHAIQGKQDFYSADYSDPAACHAALEDYLDSLYALSGLPDCYDTLAHILYPVRYIRQAGQDIDLTQRDYPERLRRVLERVARAGKALEVNTWRGRTTDEWEPILRQFKALGGEYVTVGSDAHKPQDVGKGVAEAYEVLRRCGFRCTAVYRDRKPIMEAI